MVNCAMKHVRAKRLKSIVKGIAGYVPVPINHHSVAFNPPRPAQELVMNRNTYENQEN